MKTIFRKFSWIGIKLVSAITIAVTSLSANAALIDGSATSAADAACAVDPTCSLSRGGLSDVMTVYGSGNAVFARIFAFGNEETGNIYYFNPGLVTADATQLNNYSTVINSTPADKDGVSGQVSDTFGTVDLGSSSFALAFQSEPGTSGIPIAGPSYLEKIGLNPNNWIMEPGVYLSVEYDATLYLSQAMRDAGYTAGFQSEAIPAPTALILFGIGAITAASQRRRSTGNVTLAERCTTIPA
ncbi:MAG: hypothetical protein PHR16_13250 [Methylovulum sp.]|nr:hypothetical protein [Methylovulum sp.]